jgi:integrase
MSEKRIVVWVQHFADRPYLVLQWHDEHGKRKSKSAETCNPLEAETKRADLEYELNNGLHKQASAMGWAKFRGLFEAEYVSGVRARTAKRYAYVLDQFEKLARPNLLRSVNERTVSAFVAALRQKQTRGRVGMMPSTIRVTLQFLHTALTWAAEQKLIPAVPKFPAVKVPKKKPQPVPAESFERLLEKAPDEQTRTFLLVGRLSGLRLNEALALDWEPTAAAP